MVSRRPEDAIEMEQRHIREAMVWIARQEGVVARLELMGLDEHALRARETLVRFFEFLALARERLDYLERKRPANAPEPKL